MDGERFEARATEAYLVGRDAEAAELFGRAHAAHAAEGSAAAAARAAFWAGFVLTNAGERAPGAGWLARCRRAADEAGDCAARGFLLLPQALERIAAGDFAAALDAFTEAVQIGRAFGDRDLLNLALQGRGRTLLALGRATEGLPLLDEAMVAVTAREVSPVVTGVIYCSVITACFDILDVRRAQEWTTAMNDWCATQPEGLRVRGECVARRAEIMTIHGQWEQALAEAERAAGPSAPNRFARGAATYLIAEIHRMRGEFEEAEALFQRVIELGRSPHPGLALLRLDQGRPEAARAALAPAVEAARPAMLRARLLPAWIEILLADGDVEAAAQAAEELAAHARTYGQPWLRAASLEAAGAVALARRQPAPAAASLREAVAEWRELGAHYQLARAIGLAAVACRDCGDVDTARIELGAASRILAELGAGAERARIDTLLESLRSPAAGGLTARETEVLKLVANGLTNRAIAESLKLSEKTVARHLSNIFTKLDVSSRAAATAYAFRHKIT